MPISNAGQSNIGVVIRADGVVETTNGIRLTAAETKKLGDALSEAANDAKKFDAAQQASVVSTAAAANAMKSGATAAKDFEAQQKGLNATSVALVSTLTTLAVDGVMKFTNSLIAAGRASIDQGAEVARLAEKYDVAAETISTLRYAADLSDTSIEAVTSGMDKLGKNAVQAARGVGEGRIAFEALGISVKDSEGKLKSQDTLLFEVADRISKVADSTTRATLAQMLFGRAGADLIPFLNNGADGLKRLQEEGKQWAEISGISAEEAKKLKDQQVALDYASKALGKSLATELLPRINAVIEAYLKAKREGAGWLDIIGRITVAVATGGESNWNRNQLVSTEKKVAETQQAYLDRVAAFGSDSGQAIMLKGKLDRLRAERDSLQAAVKVSEPDFFVDRGKNDKGEKIDVTLPGKGGSKGGAAKDSDFDKLAVSIQEKIALEKAEAEGTEKLTAARKMLIRLDVEEAEGKTALSEIERAQVEVWIEQWEALEKSNTARKETAKLNEEARKHYEQHIAQLERSTTQMDEQNRRMAEQNEEIGLTSQQLYQLKVRRAEVAAAAARQAENEGRLNEVSERELELLKQRTDAADRFVELVKSSGERTEAAAAWKRQEEEAKRAADNIERALTDSLMRSFDSGKSASEAFWQGMKNMARTTILQPVIKAIVDPYTQPLAQAAQSVSSGLGGWLSGLFGNSTSPYGSAADDGTTQGILDAIVQPLVAHSGGIVGDSLQSIRALPASTWAGARRYHAGGIAGDEVPAILRRGEEVLTERDPRHRNNAGGTPQVVINLQQAQGVQTQVSQSQQPDGSILVEMVQSVLLQDGRENGPITQMWGNIFGSRRQALT